jgi:hypothetical protein
LCSIVHILFDIKQHTVAKDRERGERKRVKERTGKGQIGREREIDEGSEKYLDILTGR